MSGDPALPFGRTSTDAAELTQLIDVETAVEQAATGGVENAHERVTAFVECLPRLLSWLDEHGRRYPWRNTTDPWRVYVSEILLQRTRGDAVAGIYEEVFTRFPGPEQLYRASESEIEDTVYSLGFTNHRTRTLQEVGELVWEEHDGRVPDSVAELKEPWRVGEYSARACQIFARGEALALVDTNFARVVGRVLDYEMPSQPHKSDEVYALLEALVPDDPSLARAFNLAILDLGALVCTAENPDCPRCPLNAGCAYYESQSSSDV